MAMLLLIALKIAVAVLIMAIGMNATLADVTYLWRRPGLLLRSMLAMYLLVPLAVYLLMQLFALGPELKASLFVLAVSAGAPLLPRKLGSVSGDTYVFSLVVASSIMAILLAPLSVSLLSHYFGVQQELPLQRVFWELGKAFLFPLAAGMALRKILPVFCVAVGDRLTAIAGAVLAVTTIVLLFAQRQVLLQLDWHGFVILTAVMLTALLIGHVCGGTDPANRTVLAVACATRHIGIAILVASAFPNSHTLVLTLAYTLSSACVSIPYLYWRG